MAERKWTDEDIEIFREVIKEVVKEVVEPHQCRFPEVSDQEFRDTWPTVKALAKTTQQVQTISVKLVITAIVLFLMGLTARGVFQWIAEIPHKVIGSK